MSALPPLYYATHGLLQPGDRIYPGSWGRVTLGIGAGGKNFLREYLFERIRDSEFPALPSRMQCLFLFEDLGYAAGFRRGPDKLPELVYEVRLEHLDVPIHRADMAWTLAINELKTFDACEVAARRYWRGEDHQPASKSIEYLVVGTAIVERRASLIPDDDL
jgi:hypothetical protein